MNPSTIELKLSTITTTTSHTIIKRNILLKSVAMVNMYMNKYTVTEIVMETAQNEAQES